jgi:methionyl-tRNA synthetase
MKYLITSALPYANGPIHFGHIAGVYLPADIYTRHRKLQGKRAIHISGSDEHGVAIMQNAQKAGMSYQEYVNIWHQEHKELFEKYEIKFDFFGQTSAAYHKEEVLAWFAPLMEKGFIEKKAEEQLQCQDCHNYLPDRYVEGTCYECGYEKARGDECPSCGTWIVATKLINPVCKFCESKNIEVKSVDQWYLMLSKFHKEFRDWFAPKMDKWRKTVVTFVDALSKEGMVDRAITRDLDWGIDVPLSEAAGKKFYVWFDAPIGYVSNTKEFLKQAGSTEDYLKDWWQNTETEIINFIGKDNVIFHGIIFPMMSLASGRARAVDTLPANQYVNLEGKQFSKSSGWYVDADGAISQFGSDALRYYLTSLIPESSDSSFTWTGFEAKLNNELANNIGNFINRSLKFYFKNWAEGLAPKYFESFFTSEQAEKAQAHIHEFHKLMDEVQIKRGLESIMHLGQTANTFFSDAAPWAQMKVDEEAAATTIAHSAIYGIILGALFAPFLPTLSHNILKQFPDLTADITAQVYQGNLAVLKDYFNKTIALTGEPAGLVPKIDNTVIKQLEEELKSKSL